MVFCLFLHHNSYRDETYLIHIYITSCLLVHKFAGTRNRQGRASNRHHTRAGNADTEVFKAIHGRIQYPQDSYTRRCRKTSRKVSEQELRHKDARWRPQDSHTYRVRLQIGLCVGDAILPQRAFAFPDADDFLQRVIGGAYRAQLNHG